MPNISIRRRENGVLKSLPGTWTDGSKKGLAEMQISFGNDRQRRHLEEHTHVRQGFPSQQIEGEVLLFLKRFDSKLKGCKLLPEARPVELQAREIKLVHEGCEQLRTPAMW